MLVTAVELESQSEKITSMFTNIESLAAIAEEKLCIYRSSSNVTFSEEILKLTEGINDFKDTVLSSRDIFLLALKVLIKSLQLVIKFNRFILFSIKA